VNIENKTYMYLLIILTVLAKPKDIIKVSWFTDVIPFLPRAYTH